MARIFCVSPDNQDCTAPFAIHPLEVVGARVQRLQLQEQAKLQLYSKLPAWMVLVCDAGYHPMGHAGKWPMVWQALSRISSVRVVYGVLSHGYVKLAVVARRVCNSPRSFIKRRRCPPLLRQRKLCTMHVRPRVQRKLTFIQDLGVRHRAGPQLA